MILRRRLPDGRDLSVDLGPGPVGRPPRRGTPHAFALTMADAMAPAVGGLWGASTEKRKAEMREWRRAERAKP